jgi:predicted ester cyclase
MNTTIAVFWIAVLAIIAGCDSQRIGRTEGISDENKALAHRWIEEGFNKQNLVVVDELFAEQFSVNGQTVGRDGLKTSMSRHLMGFPDLHVTIDDTIAEGNKVGIWYTVEGTHQGRCETPRPRSAQVIYSRERPVCHLVCPRTHNNRLQRTVMDKVPAFNSLRPAAEPGR